jgi:hypothetical protein
LPRVRVAFGEEVGRRLERCDHRLERRHRIGRAGDGGHQQLLQRARAREQDLALVGEVPEEGPLREPRTLGDLRHRGLLEPALGIELQRRLLQAATRVRLPPAHAPILDDDSN